MLKWKTFCTKFNLAQLSLFPFFSPSSVGGLFSMRPPVAGTTFAPFLFHWLKCSGVFVLRIYCPSSTPIPEKVAGAAPGQFSCSTNESLSLAASPHSDGQARWAGPGKSRDNNEKRSRKTQLANANENFKCLRSVGKMFLYRSRWGQMLRKFSGATQLSAIFSFSLLYP